MAKLNSILREVLYEEKERNLKIIYSVDIFIQDFPEQEEEEPEEPVQASGTETGATETETPEAGAEQVVGTPEAPVESVKEKKNLITEEIYKFESSGSLVVPQEDAKKILTINDLIEYLGDKKDEEGKQIFNDLVVQTIKALAGVGTQKAVQDLLNEGDQLNVTIDYGFDQDDSIGLQVSKNKGVNMATIIMRKDGSPMTGEFSVPVFNQTITGVFLKEIQ